MADAGLIYVYVMIIFFVMLIINFLTIRNKRENKEVRTLRAITILAGMCMLDNIAIALNDRMGVAYPLYSVYFAGIDLLLFSFILFMAAYTSMEESRAVKLITRIFGALCLIDVFSLILNTWTKHAYTLLEMKDESGQLYFVCSAKLIYTLHLYFDYLMILVMFVMLIGKAMRVAKIYRLRYISYVIVLSIIVVANMIYMLFELKNDWSVCLYGLFIVAVTYISQNYTVEKLKTAILHQIIEQLDDGLLIFDENGDNIYANDLAMKILGMDNMEMVTDRVALERYLLDGAVEDDGITIRQDEGIGRYYKIFIQKIADKNGLDVGSYYIMRDVTQMMHLIAEEKEKHEVDKLTGLNEREHFFELVSERIKHESDTKFLLVCTNYENFRLLNQIFGRIKGDEILHDTAERFRMCTDDAIYGRVDGDCFGMLVPLESYHEKMFIDLAGRVDKLMEQNNYTMRLMMGVYEISDRTVPISVMCDKALLAARQGKGGYRKRIFYFSDEMERQLVDEQQYAAKLFDAIVGGEIRMMLQPIVDIDGNVRGAEGLVRWYRAGGRTIMPDEFIDFFEEAGIIYKLDLYMWREAVRELKRWQDLGRDDLFVSVNISAGDIYRADIYGALVSLVEEYGVEPSRLHLEIAELSMRKNQEKQLTVLEQLRQKGFVVWMDNFGSAYSSFGVLRNLSVDAIKLDMAAVYSEEDRERTRQVLDAFLAIGKSLGVELIPERVASEDMYHMIRDVGCTTYQGNYFDGAISPEEFERRYL